MNKLDRPTLEKIERESAIAAMVESQIMKALPKNSEYMFYDDIDTDNDVAEAWGDFYCILNEILND